MIQCRVEGIFAAAVLIIATNHTTQVAAFCRRRMWTALETETETDRVRDTTREWGKMDTVWGQNENRAYSAHAWQWRLLCLMNMKNVRYIVGRLTATEFVLTIFVLQASVERFGYWMSFRLVFLKNYILHIYRKINYAVYKSFCSIALLVYSHKQPETGLCKIQRNYHRVYDDKSA